MADIWDQMAAQSYCHLCNGHTADSHNAAAGANIIHQNQVAASDAGASDDPQGSALRELAARKSVHNDPDRQNPVSIDQGMRESERRSGGMTTSGGSGQWGRGTADVAEEQRVQVAALDFASWMETHFGGCV